MMILNFINVWYREKVNKFKVFKIMIMGLICIKFMDLIFVLFFDKIEYLDDELGICIFFEWRMNL